jgi:hypothetical protein
MSEPEEWSGFKRAVVISALAVAAWVVVALFVYIIYLILS